VDSALLQGTLILVVAVLVFGLNITEVGLSLVSGLGS